MAPTNLLDLPPEILTAICRLFSLHIETSPPHELNISDFFDQQDNYVAKADSMRDLRILSLTCRTLRRHAEPVLFRDIQLVSSYNNLIDAMRHGHELDTAVRHFTSDEVMTHSRHGIAPSPLRLPGHSHIQDAATGRPCQCVQPVLALTRNLTSLTLGMTDVVKFCKAAGWSDRDTSVRDFVPLLDRVKKLALWQTRSLDDTLAAHPDIYQILRHTPKLQSLVARHADFNELFWGPLESEQPELVTPALGSLRVVFLQECNISNTPEEVGKFTFWMSLLTGLEALSVKGSPRLEIEASHPRLTPAAVVDAVSSARETLKWLEIDTTWNKRFPDADFREYFPTTLSRLGALEALLIHCRSTDWEGKEEPEDVAARLAYMVPRTVKYLCIYTNYRSSTDRMFIEKLVERIEASSQPFALQLVCMSFSLCKCMGHVLFGTDADEETVEDCFDSNQPFADEVAELLEKVGVEICMTGSHWLGDRWEFDGVGKVSFQKQPPVKSDFV